MRNKRERRAGQEKRMRKLPTRTVGTMTPNRRLIAQYSDVYRPIIDTCLFRARIHSHQVRGVRVHGAVCVHVESTTERYAQFKTANAGRTVRCALEGERTRSSYRGFYLIVAKRRVTPPVIRVVDDRADRIGGVEERERKRMGDDRNYSRCPRWVGATSRSNCYFIVGDD